VCWRGPGCLEQRYRAVPEVLDEWVPVTVVARRYGVARQTVHGWLRRYANEDRELESR
jgi:transposase-like protein